MNGFYNDLKGWVSRPFKTDMNMINWVLFIGFIIVVALLWQRVLKTLEI